MEPIAIIGQSFRLPQSDDEQSFWEMIKNGRNAMTEWPKSRANIDSFYHTGTRKKSSMTSRGAHFLDLDPSVFDAPFFSVTSKEATSMDPQQRWLLETSYRAFENAGIPVETVVGTPTSVFAASMTDDYSRIVAKDPDEAPTNTATGNNPSILANRLSWYFDLRGPSITVNTACSSSMTAMDLACQSLRSGQSVLALVGGATALLSIETSVYLHNMNFLSSDSHCYSFDARANGYARGEGVVVLLLKKLSDAVRDGDSIRAVVRGTGLNQDGHTPGLTLPSQAAQEQLVRRVYRDCGLEFDTTRYIEAHGTGTQAGDSTEANVIGRVFGMNRSPENPLYIGSVKSNLGHLEGASALASIVKCIMILEKGVIAPNALFEKMNPKINAKFYNLVVPKRCIDWPTVGLRRVSINSFGFGGSNGHLILDDAYHTLEALSLQGIHNTLARPKTESSSKGRTKFESNVMGKLTAGDDDRDDLKTDTQSTDGSISTKSSVPFNTSGATSPSDLPAYDAQPQLLVFSARDESALNRIHAQYYGYLNNSTSNTPETTQRLAYVLSQRRSISSWRSVAIAGIHSTGDLQFSTPVKSLHDHGLAFVFTGQGAQYVNMGRSLIHFRVFRETLEAVNKIFQKLGAEWTLIDELENMSHINRPEYSQPLCTALQIALFELLSSWGITPLAVVGHSSGEIAAAYATGMLSLESACKVAFHRGRLSGVLALASSGAMMSVNINEADLPLYLENIADDGDVCVACINSPTNITLSGNSSSLDVLQARFDKDGIFAKKLNTGVAYHSPAMRTISAEYLQCLHGISRGSRPMSCSLMVSSVTGVPISATTASEPQYWVDNLVAPVRFVNSLEYIAVIGPKENRQLTIHDFLELGPHGALQRAVKDTLNQLGKKASYMSALSRFKEPLTAVFNVAGSLFSKGYPLDVSAVNQYDEKTQKTKMFLELPAYPFDRSQRYWFESRLSSDWRLRGSAPPDVLGARAADWNPLEPRWRKLLNVAETPWILDHVVGDTIIYPGAATLIMALEAVRQTADPAQIISGFTVKEATFMNPIVIKPESDSLAELVTQLRPLRQTYEKSSVRSEIRIFGRQEDIWRECFCATIHIEYEVAHRDGMNGGAEATVTAKTCRAQWERAVQTCDRPIEKEQLYNWLKSTGLQYGDTFQIVEGARWDGKEIALSHININPTEHQFGGIMHPTVFDAICQTSFAAPSGGGKITLPTLVPHKIHETWFAPSGWQYPHTSQVRVTTTSKLKTGVSGLDCKVVALADDGTLLARISKLEMLPILQNDTESEKERSLLSGIDWAPQLSLLSSSELQKYCTSAYTQNDESTQIHDMTHLEHVLRLVVQKHMPELEATNWECVPPHHRRQFDWLKKQLSKPQQYCSPKTAFNMPPRDEDLDSQIQVIHKLKPQRNLFFEIATNLPSIMRGDMSAFDIHCTAKLSAALYADVFTQMCDDRFESYLNLVSHQTPALRVLEVGAGTGGWTSCILSAFQRREERTDAMAFSEYIFTDISTSFFEKVDSKFSAFGARVKYTTLDITSDPLAQGFNPESFDIIFAGSVLHATANLSRSLENLRLLLKPQGQLVIQEPTRPNSFPIGLAFGVLDGWWLGEEDYRQLEPTVTEGRWDSLLRESGFSGNNMVLRDYCDDSAHTFSIMISTRCEKSPDPLFSTNSQILYVVEDGDYYQLLVASKLMEVLTSLSRSVMSLSELKDPSRRKADYVIILAEMGSSLLTKLESTTFNTLKACLQTWTNILWVTSPSSVSDAPFEGAKDGFLRSLRSESHNKRIVSLTLEISDKNISHIRKVFEAAFSSENPELEYAVRNDRILIPRLISEPLLSTALNATLYPHISTSSWLPGPPLKLDILHRGQLETLHFSEDLAFQTDILPDEVEIEAKAWGVSFRDMFIALGRLEENDFGADCAGIVTRVGSNVTHVKEGDNVAKLQKEEKILIHSAAGGTGQLAVMIAQMVGAEVFCTVGYQEKKDLLIQELGVKEDHIFYSRDTSFKNGILRMTNGCGVDVVLNSLVGEGLRASWECIAAYGRFIELGKADIKSNAQLPMGSFAKNVSFTAVDIRHISQSRPRLGDSVWANLLDLADKRILHCPQPLHIYGVDKVEEAFRYFQSGKNTGRTIITADSSAIKRLLERRTWKFETDASYLIAGGLGGIGRAMMRWMASRGAKNLIVLSRFSRTSSGSKAAAEVIDDLAKLGIKVATPRCDVSSASSLCAALEGCAKTMPPIRGCINAAMVLQDSIFDNMTHSQWTETVNSKVSTSWNLHLHLPSDLDFFILLASVAGVIGSPGQANYAAGCTFQDALARHRVSHGQNAISIDLGAMRSIGIIAETGRLQKTFENMQGMVKIEDGEFFALLDVLCDPGRPRTTAPEKSLIAMGLVTPADMMSNGEDPLDMMQRPLFANFAQPRVAVQHVGSSSLINFKAKFAQTEGYEARANLVVEALAHKLARALSITSEDVDASKPLHVFGVDSLVAVELRNWMGKEFAADVAIFDIMGSPSVASLGDLVARLSKLSKVA
ncbi:polyketide synthase PksD [Amniculicola lignicola CBS 123094]|uniref:Polyketide synthase PksD n=1 Tax=Amniculicola lignicola CBS 123094 TaxID=1392246 RepID=A0A6A5WTK2_9PLEO|nr:polyketide synthase PksD [Amniculicola lignicola CBS 123094]